MAAITVINSTTGSPDGSYEINGIWPGHYVVRAESPGYEQKYYDDTYKWDSATPLVINANDDIENLDFALEQGFSIQGYVKNKHLPDGSFKTGLEVLIDDDFYGTLPDDIDSITVTAPSGQLPITKDNFDYLDQWLDMSSQLVAHQAGVLEPKQLWDWMVRRFEDQEQDIFTLRAMYHDGPRFLRDKSQKAKRLVTDLLRRGYVKLDGKGYRMRPINEMPK